MKSIEEAISDVFLWLTTARNASSSSGMKYHLAGIAADIAGLAQRLHDEVLERVKQDAVMDIGIDFAALSQRLLTMELEEYAQPEVQEEQLQVTEALGELSAVVEEITAQLERHHRDEEFVRLYEKEKNSYLASGAARYSRKRFEEWKDNSCNGEPTLEDIEDYRLEKLLQMFGTGVFNGVVEHIMRAKRYPGEIDFDQLEPNPKITKSAVHHYAALRRLADYEDGCLKVNPLHVGKYFYAQRNEENAKAHRTNFLKYMHKVELAQQELRKLLQKEEKSASYGLCHEEAEETLNLFAPTKHLKLLLQEEWFAVLTTDDKRFNGAWAECFVDALMASAWGEQIARDWAVKDKRLTLKCMIVGTLKDAGVLRGSYSQIAKLLNMDGENADTLAKYLGLGKKQAYADWITEYTNPA